MSHTSDVFEFTLTPEAILAKKATRWWIEKIVKEKGWELFKTNNRPLSWLDETIGSASYAPATGWLLNAVDFQKGLHPIRFEPFMEKLVPRKEDEAEWVEEVQKVVVAMYTKATAK